jgi:hypothetical protein
MHEHEPTRRWVGADTWIRAAEASLEREPRTVATALARLDRDPARRLAADQDPDKRLAADQEMGAGAHDRRWFEDAADLAWRVGVRPAARQLGVAHSTLLSGWKRHGVGRPTGPRNQHTVGR